MYEVEEAEEQELRERAQNLAVDAGGRPRGV